jgi:hypothetical protein
MLVDALIVANMVTGYLIKDGVVNYVDLFRDSRVIGNDVIFYFASGHVLYEGNHVKTIAERTDIVTEAAGVKIRFGAGPVGMIDGVRLLIILVVITNVSQAFRSDVSPNRRVLRFEEFDLHSGKGSYGDREAKGVEETISITHYPLVVPVLEHTFSALPEPGES